MNTPTFPKCTVRGHDHELVVLMSITPPNGSTGWSLECPTGKYRFLYIESVWKSLGKMHRRSEPRWGWSVVEDRRINDWKRSQR